MNYKEAMRKWKRKVAKSFEELAEFLATHEIPEDPNTFGWVKVTDIKEV